MDITIGLLKRERVENFKPRLLSPYLFLWWNQTSCRATRGTLHRGRRDDLCGYPLTLVWHIQIPSAAEIDWGESCSHLPRRYSQYFLFCYARVSEAMKGLTPLISRLMVSIKFRWGCSDLGYLILGDFFHLGIFNLLALRLAL
jgi:hypothetical protein